VIRVLWLLAIIVADIVQPAHVTLWLRGER
jgi:hypothetical protein